MLVHHPIHWSFLRMKRAKPPSGLLLLLLIGCAAVSQAKINVHELRCEVCQRTVEEMVKEVDTVDPDKRVHVGEFMLDANGT